MFKLFNFKKKDEQVNSKHKPIEKISLKQLEKEINILDLSIHRRSKKL